MDDKNIRLWYNGVMNRKAELLSPAGNAEALRAAVINGADAVYLALDRFGARAKADNFTLDSLGDAVTYAHLYGVRVYVTINTLLTDAEIPTALTYVEKANACGVDAFIVQDLGFAREIRHRMPDIILHASTQMGIHNAEGALFAETLGFRRVVLARETGIEDIRLIRENTSLEIEYFVQGALCVAFSGNCYLSSLVSGLSGNRGRCLQLCRKCYHAEGAAEGGYYLSPADICMLDRLPELFDAGVDSFKIEGRLRRTEYVAETTRIYRAAIDRGASLPEDRNALKKVFNRGDYCEGYLRGNDVIYPFAQGHTGLGIGHVDSVRDGKAFLRANGIQKGDGLKFLRGGKETGSALSTGNPTTYSGNVRPGDEVRLTSSSSLTEEVRRRERAIYIDAAAMVSCGLPIKIALTCGDVMVSVTGDTPQAARCAPLSDVDIKASICKTGDTVFSVQTVLVDNDGKSFVPKAELNRVRREGIERLKIALLDRYNNDFITKKRKAQENALKNKNTSTMSKNIQYSMSDVIYVIESLEQLERVLSVTKDENIIINPKIYTDSDVREMIALCAGRAILNLPIMADRADMEILRALLEFPELKAVCANNVYAFTFARTKAILRGYGLNALNGCLEGAFVQSLEAGGVIRKDAYVYAFGRAPLMTFKHCPRKTVYGCASCVGDYELRLRDDKGSFRIRHYKLANCYAQLTGERPVMLFEELNRCGHCRRIIDFTGCSVTEVETVLRGDSIPHVHFNFNKTLV